MDILKILRRGLVSIAESYVDRRDYVRPEDGPKKDHDNLVGDVRMVGTDINQAINTYGEQSYKRPGDKQQRAAAFH